MEILTDNVFILLYEEARINYFFNKALNKRYNAFGRNAYMYSFKEPHECLSLLRKLDSNLNVVLILEEDLENSKYHFHEYIHQIKKTLPSVKIISISNKIESNLVAMDYGAHSHIDKDELILKEKEEWPVFYQAIDNVLSSEFNFSNEESDDEFIPMPTVVETKPRFVVSAWWRFVQVIDFKKIRN